MPFVEIPRTSFVKKIEPLIGKGFESLAPRDAARIAKQEHQKVLGYGRDHLVIPYPNKTDIVVAVLTDPRVTRMTGAEARKYYYLSRIARTLFPDNFARVISIGSNPPDGSKVLMGSVRQRIIPDKIGNFIKEIDLKDGSDLLSKLIKKCNLKRHFVKKPFKIVLDALQSYKLPIPYDVGNLERNLILSRGNECYVDILDNAHMTWDYEQTLEYMKEGNYPEKEIDIVKKSMDRLRIIA